MKLPIKQFSPVSCHFPLLGINIYAAPYTQTPSAIVRLRGWHAKFRASSKFRPNCIAVYCNVYTYFGERKRKTSCYELNGNTHYPECNPLLISSCMQF